MQNDSITSSHLPSTISHTRSEAELVELEVSIDLLDLLLKAATLKKVSLESFVLQAALDALQRGLDEEGDGPNNEVMDAGAVCVSEGGEGSSASAAADRLT